MNDHKNEEHEVVEGFRKVKKDEEHQVIESINMTNTTFVQPNNRCSKQNNTISNLANNYNTQFLHSKKSYKGYIIVSAISISLCCVVFALINGLSNRSLKNNPNSNSMADVSVSEEVSSKQNNVNSESDANSDGKLSEAERTRILNDAQSKASAEDFVSAIEIIVNAQKEYGEDPSFSNLYNEFSASYKKQVLTDTDELINKDDYVGAIQMLSDALLVIDDAELLAKKESCESTYVSSVIDQAEELLATKDYDGADAIVDSALLKILDNSELKKEKDKISKLKPVYLLDEISPYQRPYYYEYSDKISMGGNNYSHGFTCMGYKDSPSGHEMYFNLNAEYSEMSFIIGIVNRNESKGDVTFSFFSDGELIDEYTMESSDLPEKHKIDVKGCKQLKIVVYDGYMVAAYSGTYGVAEIEITRDLSGIYDKSIKNKLAEGQVYLLDEVSPYQRPYYYEYSDKISMGGNDYSHGFTCMGYRDSPSGHEMYYNLNAEYSEMSFIIGIVNRNESKGDVTFSFFSDGELIDEYTMESSDLPEKHKIDVKGCKQLKIVVYDGCMVAAYSGTYGVAEIVLTSK